MHPLRFQPIIKRALWGGRRLEQQLGKQTGNLSDASESWEISDVTGNSSIVSSGPLAGASLRELMTSRRDELLGRHAGCEQFPLLIKFLDAQQQLSVQVHPEDSVDPRSGLKRAGKAEAWYVLAADPGSCMYLGLMPGITEHTLREAIAADRFEHCLHKYHPRPGDCIYLPPGTVHALGGGLLIAEIQQTSDTTYRLHDWGRVDAQGRPRELHLEQGYECIDYSRGPVTPSFTAETQEVCSAPPDSPSSDFLVRCEYFEIRQHRGPGLLPLPDDHRMHIFVVVQGSFSVDGDSLHRGNTLLIPADGRPRRMELNSEGVVLDAFLPDDFAPFAL